MQMNISSNKYHSKIHTVFTFFDHIPTVRGFSNIVKTRQIKNFNTNNCQQDLRQVFGYVQFFNKLHRAKYCLAYLENGLSGSCQTLRTIKNRKN